mgnify:FL=1
MQGKYSLPHEFPYDAMNPMSVRQQTFNSIDDVYIVLNECHDKCVEKGFSRLGEALYQQSLFIVNDVLLLDEDMQNLIKKYQFCKKFNAPPYPSLQDTPANIVESFMIIDDEITQFSTKEKNG